MASESGSALLKPGKLFSVADVLGRPNAAPREPGLYGWWFDTLPQVSLEGSPRCGPFCLAYIGIASHREGSRRTLAQRLRNHCRGPTAASTLRRSLAALLSDELDLRPALSPRRKVQLTEGEEGRLSAWLSTHGRLSWVTDPKPWELERELLADGPPLVLNIRGNNHPFASQLGSLRRGFLRAPRA